MNNKKLIYGIIGVLMVVCIIAISAIAIVRVINARGSLGSNINLNTEGTEVKMKENTLSVVGLGKVNIKPDVAYLDVGVRTMDKDAKKAQDENKSIMNKIMAKLKALKIEEEDIQTSAYNIWPRYNYNGNKQILEGYEVENMVRVTVREIDSVGDILDGVSKEGANLSYGISFGVLDTDSVYKQALEKAIDDAKGKAEVMGKMAEVSIQKPLAIYEGNGYSASPKEPMNKTRLMADSIEAEAIQGVPIASGELEIQAYVTVIYEIK
jgi:uncharacterized protein YggE